MAAFSLEHSDYSEVSDDYVQGNATVDTQGGGGELLKINVEPEPEPDDTNVDEIINPHVGMTFTGSEEFAAFMYSYAYKRGLEIVIRSTELKQEYKGKGVCRTSSGKKEPLFHMYKRMRMVCNKGRQRKQSDSNVANCKFVVDARFCKEKSVMEITTCHLEHNHVIVPENRRFMVSYRFINDYFKNRIMLNDAAGMSMIENYNSIVLECGGHENVPFNYHDLRNAVYLKRHAVRLGEDALTLEETTRMKRSMEITRRHEYLEHLASYSDEAYAIYQRGMAELIKKLEDHVGVDKIKSFGTGSDTLEVWGRRRLQRKEDNLRHIVRNAATQVDDCIGRASTSRQLAVTRKNDGSSQPTPSKRRCPSIIDINF